METILYFLLWAGLIFMTMRLMFDAHVIGQGGHDREGTAASRNAPDGLTWVPPEKDVDPVCGKTVTTSKAKPSVFNGRVFYFCSRECREVFEAAPEIYVGEEPLSRRPRQLEHSHVRT